MNLVWENAYHAFLDWNNLKKPPLPAEIMHHSKRWSEDGVSIKRRTTLPTSLQM